MNMRLSQNGLFYFASNDVCKAKRGSSSVQIKIIENKREQKQRQRE